MTSWCHLYSIEIKKPGLRKGSRSDNSCEIIEANGRMDIFEDLLTSVVGPQSLWCMHTVCRCATKMRNKPWETFTVFLIFSRHRHEHSCASLQIKKVYFYWICPNTNAFEWFAQLLESLETQVKDVVSKLAA
jgi:hypothetical protein